MICITVLFIYAAEALNISFKWHARRWQDEEIALTKVLSNYLSDEWAPMKILYIVSCQQISEQCKQSFYMAMVRTETLKLRDDAKIRNLKN